MREKAIKVSEAELRSAWEMSRALRHDADPPDVTRAHEVHEMAVKFTADCLAGFLGDPVQIEVVALQSDTEAPGLWIGFKTFEDRDRAAAMFCLPDGAASKQENPDPPPDIGGEVQRNI